MGRQMVGDWFCGGADDAHPGNAWQRQAGSLSLNTSSKYADRPHGGYLSPVRLAAIGCGLAPSFSFPLVD